MPSRGQHVRCFLKIGTMVEGIVEVWLDQQVVLKSLNERSVFLLSHPDEDIVLTEIVLPEREVLEIQVAIKEKLEEIQKPIEDTEINSSNIQQLKKMLAEQGKKMISDRIREHSISEAKHQKYEDKYELPGFFKKSST